MEAFRCYCFGNTTLWLVIAGYCAALVLYGLIYFSAKKLARHTFWTKHMVTKLRLPLFCVLLEFATLYGLLIPDFDLKILADLSRAVGMLIILTFGAGMLIAAREIFHHAFQLLAKEAQTNVGRRASLTQGIFLYRAVVIGIVLLTIGAALLVFPYIRSLGFGILGSAGVLGIAVGMAARPILLNLLAGFQIGLSKIVKIGDRVVINNQDAYVESIHLTRLVLRTWDQRRLLIPISQLIDQPFENWDLKDPEIIGTVFLRCDFSVPVEAIRKKFFELVATHPAHNGRFATVLVTDLSELTMELRLAMSAPDSVSCFELRAFVREHMISFLQKEYPAALPCFRYKNFATPAEQI